MVTLTYNHVDYDAMLRHYAKELGCKYSGGILQFNEQYAHGTMQFMQLSDGLQIMISNFVANTDILFQRRNSTFDYFSLQFDEIKEPDTDQQESKSAVFLSSTKYDWLFLTKKDTHLANVCILFSKQWLDDFLLGEMAGEPIKKYLSVKSRSFNYEPLDAAYKKMIHEIMLVSEEESMKKMIIHNRIMLLLERFFSRVFQKMNNHHFDIKLNQHDINSLRMVERILLKDFSKEPPDIVELAKTAAMSPSKLKTAFKEIYGLPVYSYFQKHRMNKAKAMLLSQKYHVKDVGMELGYSNLSNFAKAFRKSFDQLPSDLLKNNSIAL